MEWSGDQDAPILLDLKYAVMSEITALDASVRTIDFRHIQIFYRKAGCKHWIRLTPEALDECIKKQPNFVSTRSFMAGLTDRNCANCTTSRCGVRMLFAPMPEKPVPSFNGTRSSTNSKPTAAQRKEADSSIVRGLRQLTDHQKRVALQELHDDGRNGNILFNGGQVSRRLHREAREFGDHGNVSLYDIDRLTRSREDRSHRRRHRYIRCLPRIVCV